MAIAEWNALMTAIEMGSMEDFVQHLVLEPKLYEKADSGFTPLMLAIDYNRVDMVKTLLQIPNVDINYATKEYSPLSIAIGHNNVAMVQLLLENGADPNYESATINPSLFDTMKLFFKKLNPLPILELLLQYGADIRAYAKKSQHDTLSFFCFFYTGFEHSYEVFDFLLQKGADATVIDPNSGSTILHYLISANRPSLILRLLDEPNLPINAVDDSGMTPLMKLMQHDTSDMRKVFAKMLQYDGIDINIQTYAGDVLTMAYIHKSQYYIDVILKMPNVSYELIINYASSIQDAKNRASIMQNAIDQIRKPVGVVREVHSKNDLTGLAGIESLIIPPMGLSELPALPDSLVYLECSNNPLQFLPPLPAGLRVLICANCGLRELPFLPDSLEYLDASNNRLFDIAQLPPKLMIMPVGKTNASNTVLHSTNLLLTDNPLPAGLLNGFGSVTQYSSAHIHRDIHFGKDVVNTMILPKGTLLFRDVTKDYIEEEVKGIYKNNKYFLYPEYNVFFYPYPFVTEHASILQIVDIHNILVFELLRDIEVLMGVGPSKNSRNDRLDSDYLVSCNKIPTGHRNIKGYVYDPCFAPAFSKLYPTINGMFVLASKDVQRHINNNERQRFWTKYRTNFIDERTPVGEVGVPEIILHPHANRYDAGSPLNYKHILTLDRYTGTYDDAWHMVEDKLRTGAWTIDLFTKLYVNYEAVSDEVKARCVPPEDPYKLHYLNKSYWKTGGSVRGVQRLRKSRRLRVKKRGKTRRVR